MGKVIAKRFIFMIPVVLAVTFIIFMLSFISAGDAARALAEKKYEHPSPEQIEEVRHEEGTGSAGAGTIREMAGSGTSWRFWKIIFYQKTGF